jgi:hypothetical protein
VQADSGIENVDLYNCDLREVTLFNAGAKSTAFHAVMSWYGRMSGRISVQ